MMVWACTKKANIIRFQKRVVSWFEIWNFGIGIVVLLFVFYIDWKNQSKYLIIDVSNNMLKAISDIR